MLFIGPLGGWEIIVILVIVLIIFGPSKLPQMGQALGKAIKEFKKAGKELRSDVTNLDDDDDDDEDVVQKKPKTAKNSQDNTGSKKSQS